MATVFYQYVGLEPMLDLEQYREDPEECVLSKEEWLSEIGEEKFNSLLNSDDLVRVVPCRMDVKTGNFVEVAQVANLNLRDDFEWMIAPKF